MQPFLSKKEAERKAAAQALACNPCPGRSQKQYQRITRCIDAVSARLRFFLEHTGYADKKWLPSEGVVHERQIV